MEGGGSYHAGADTRATPGRERRHWAPGTKVEGGWKQLRFPAGLAILPGGSGDKGVPGPVAARQMFCRSWGEALSRKTRKSLVGQLVETCSPQLLRSSQ